MRRLARLEERPGNVEERVDAREAAGLDQGAALSRA
jgi:hypothetical protein